MKRTLALCCALVLSLGLFIPAGAACNHEKSEYYIIDVFPNCYQTGQGHYFCIHCDATMGTAVVPATEFHNPTGDFIITAEKHYKKCATPGCPVKVGEEEHTPGRTIADLEPTCGTAGVGHTLCYYCDATIEIEVRIPPTEMHEPDILNPVVDIPPTCTEPGEGHIICINCGATDKPRWSIPATGQHTPGVWQIVIHPSATTPGLKERHCVHCDLLLDTDTVSVIKPSISFGDVKKSDFFYEPVQWAVEKGITSGTSKTTFAPSDACTRGQIATFLWRAAGCPTPKTSKNPFTDIKKSDYYYNAVLWAVGEGITAGTSKTTFSPSEACTRGQIVTLLWRAGGSKSPKTRNNPFNDVKKNDYYYKAVLWAVDEGVTAGTSKTSFSPATSCTRGQIVTFLYRNYN